MGSKRIAVFLDGTWNTLFDNTNVWRLKTLCVENDSQAVYYSAGVGTQFGEKIRGGMFGYGLDQEIINAYEWLIENYEDGDELFLFGFSRGAYTARSLSGLISEYGMVQLGAPLSIHQLFQRYMLGTGTKSIRQLLKQKSQKPPVPLTVEEEWLLEYSRPIPIRFVGVWDTVGALGLHLGDLQIPVISSQNYKYLEVDLRQDNTFAYHALAIDEHRKSFAPTLWQRISPAGAPPPDAQKPRSVADVEQRWFVGAHANVGGGYPSDLLAQIPLKWLMDKAISHGLQFRRDVVINGDEIQGSIVDSYADFGHGAYELVSSPFYRPIGTPTATSNGKVAEMINETIDASVFQRWRNDKDYRPQNLDTWVKAHNVDPTKLQNSVLALDPTKPAP
jgi:uncharacterized protein (DUF2235 family)